MSETAKQYSSVTISFDNRRNKTRIQKSTLNALGNPSHIVLRVDSHMKKLIIQPMNFAEAREAGIRECDLLHIPDKVYAKGQHFEIQSSRFLEYFRSFTQWHEFAQYRAKGIVRDNIACIDLLDYEVIMRGKPLRIIEGNGSCR